MSLQRRVRSKLVARLLFVFAIVLIAMIAASAIQYGRLRIGPEQPIPFSHKLHAGAKQLSCFFCHTQALRSQNAGIPPVEKCLLCHDVIASNFSPIARVRSYAAKNEPIPWVRVYQLPDFVHFSHQAHLTNASKWGKRFDCGDCHGNVKGMDRVRLNQPMQMQFCVNCHKENNFSVYCFTCHY
jgi:predicted CXXCH cytochrome family protein